MRLGKRPLIQLAFTPPPGSKDRIYWIEKEGQGYVPLTTETRQRLIAGSAKF
jgi:hypothetical protein